MKFVLILIALVICLAHFAVEAGNAVAKSNAVSTGGGNAASDANAASKGSGDAAAGSNALANK